MADDDPEHNTTYICITQEDTELPFWGSEEDSTGPPAINVGKVDSKMGQIVPRWDVSQGSTILQYFVDDSTFQGLAASEADFTANELQQAANEWNSLGLGVSISRTHSRANANFALIYEQNQGQMVDRRSAESFFPNDHDRYLIVTDVALSAKYRFTLKYVLLHELGHVLGLRHEFVLDKQQQLQLNVQEDAGGAVQFQGRNPMSVMNYTAWPTMQDSDKVAVKAFYNLKPGHLIAGSPVVDFKPEILP